MSLQVGFGATVSARGKLHQELDGIGYYTQALAAHLQPAQVQCLPVVFGPAPTSLNKQPPFNQPLVTTSAYKWLALQSAITGLSFPVANSLKQKINLFHATDHHIPKLKGIPVLATIMDAIPLSNPEWGNQQLRQFKNALWKKSVEWADHVVTISDYSKQEIMTHFQVPEDKISVVYLGVDPKYGQRLDAVRLKTCLNKHNLQRPFFLCVGTLQPRKNIGRVLEAFKQLPANIQSEFDLVIVGRNGWGVEGLVNELQNQGPASHVKWLGAVSEEDKLCLLQAATSLVFPSLSEGFGLPLLEAFAAGTPVISSNTTSLAEIAGGSALSIDPEQTESVSHAMQTLAESTQLQSELVVLGRQRAAAFTWQTCADQTAAIYKQMAR